MPKLRLAALVCIAALVGPLVTGCGASSGTPAQPAASSSAVPSALGSAHSSASQTPAISASQLLAGVQKAAAAAGSVHMSGTRTDTKSRTVSIEETGTLDGTNMHASSRYADVVYEVLVVDGAGYVKGNKAYWVQEGKLSDEQATQIGDRWVTVDAALRDEIVRMSPRQVIQNLFSTLSAADFEATVSREDAAGIPAYTVSNGGKKTVVAAVDSLLPIHLSTEGISLNFDRWNAVAPVGAPAADQVIDTSPSPAGSPSAASSSAR
ncbi:hypothetical protein SAMN05443377_1168 [Propionibacterium cyclohexanicum]|uniref:Lipoprotein n=2 Tax=Propionibacterium cyclohexanicum TaxID=64702 RepID=A0A1H9SU25_9ACTN|nr:hypothetical protein SAMN05443377_1168 [Propionibacterium cyclohexanicum]